MKIRRFEGYKAECPNCCEIYFHDKDVVIARSTLSDNPKILTYDEWKGLTLRKALEYTFSDNSGLCHMILVCVRCPVCNRVVPVWTDRLYCSADDETIKDRPVRDLIDEGTISLFDRVDAMSSNTERVYSAEEEIVE